MNNTDNNFNTVFTKLLNNKPDLASQLISDLADTKIRGFITKDELIKICMWKSPRQKQRYLLNKEEEVIEISRIAFSCTNEKVKIAALGVLEGVSTATASAILAITDPTKYGVIDIRSWLTLYYFKIVDTNPKGTSLSENNWIEYLSVIRQYAKKYNTTPRAIDLALFHYHKENLQNKKLYKY